MNHLRVSDEARAEPLDEIWFYILAQDNPNAADKFDTRHRLPLSSNSQPCRTPGVGRVRNCHRACEKFSPIGHYVIFYRPMENGVEIARCPRIAWRP